VLEMGMGTNALVEKMVQAGVCKGIDHGNCVRALSKLIGMGESGKSFAERIMGPEFEQWRTQYKKAWEEFESKGLTERDPETAEVGGWDALTSNVK